MYRDVNFAGLMGTVSRFCLAFLLTTLIFVEVCMYSDTIYISIGFVVCAHEEPELLVIGHECFNFLFLFHAWWFFNQNASAYSVVEMKSFVNLLGEVSLFVL